MTARPTSKSRLSSKQQDLLRKRLAKRANRIPQQAHNGVAPASLAQIRLWLENELIPETAVYNISRTLHLSGALDTAALKNSLNSIVQRHETLRTTFQQQGDQIMQLIQPELTLTVPLIDLGSVPAQRVEKIIEEEVKRPFSLTTGPLIRAKLFHLNKNKHILLLTMHHIIADGWSIRVFWQEFNKLYAAHSGRQSLTLPPLPVQYADFSRWQQSQSQAEKRQQQLTYWRKKLDNLPARLDLPADRPRPAFQSFRGDIHSFTLPNSLLPALKQLSQQHGATLFMTLLAAFQVFISRYSGQKDIVIGTPVAGRNHSDLQNLIGFFVNTLVLRSNLTQNPTFHDFLGQTRKVVMEALDHQETPFEKLVKELQPQRTLNHAPIFQILFAMESTHETNVMLPGLTCQLAQRHSATAKVDLTLFVKEADAGLICTWEYDTALFDAATIQRMTANWQTLLAGITANPNLPITQLPLLSQEDQQLLAAWNDNRAAYPREASVQQLFEAQVAQTPDQTALVFADAHISYADLNRRANQLARHLRRLGVGAETLVGLSLERSVEMIVGMLAILKAGGAYLPLDASYPQERLAFMLADGNVSVLLTQQKLRANLPVTEQMTLLCLDSDWEQVAAAADSNLSSNDTAVNLAYVMYTSGSTGQPKGVAVTHRNIVRLVKNNNYAQLTPNETLLQFAPISFDAATFEIWGSLLNGARLIIAPPQQLSLTELTALVQAESVSTLWLTAGLFHLVADEHLDALGSVRQLLAGGDMLSLSHIRKTLKQLPNCQISNGYGPTENTTFTTCCALSPTEVLETAVPIGKPISNTQVYVLDEKLGLAPIGVPGELYTGGDGLARGYLNQAGLTAASFIPHPFATYPGERLYRTGDMARWTINGRLDFLGRIDNQVKIRGYRIEQGEIETVLSQHPHVHQSVVLVFTSPTRDKYLVAYVLPAVEALSTDDLQQYLSHHLPAYMIPATWVVMDEFPLNPNGKVDRRALPEPDISQRQATTAFAQPTTPSEIMLAKIWTDVLGIEQIGIHDNFFELGGHSLLATQIISRIRKQLQQEISLLTLFQFPTIAGLVKTLTSTPKTAAVLNIDTSLRQEVQQIVTRDGQKCIALPASFAQRRLWTLDQLDPNSALYNVPFPLELQGDLDSVALELALTDLIARHESLRTTFEMINGTSMQIIHPADLVDLPLVSDEEPNPATLEQQIAAEAGRPFDLAVDSLFRATLYEHSFDRHTLLLVMHHVISDGWSMPILLRELIALYEEYAEGTPADLSPLPIQYADYALWQAQQLAGEGLAEPLRYWREQFAVLPSTLELPTDRPRSATQTFAGANNLFSLPDQVVANLQALSQKLDMTPYMIALAAFLVLLKRYTRQNDIVVGSPSANRTVPEQEGLIGFFVNMLALRADLSGDPTVSELLAQIRETVLAAQARQEMPFEKLVDELGLERSLTHTPLFQVSFTYDVGGNKRVERPFLTWTTRDLGIGLVKYDLRLGLRDAGDKIEAVITYNTDLFNGSTMDRMAKHYINLLSAILTQPDNPVATLSILSDSEWEMQQAWNQKTQVDFGKLRCPFQQIEQVSRQMPDQLALMDTATKQGITFAELNQRANQLAHFLRQEGITAESRVGICLDRSPLTAIAAMAIWKAGGAYVPLDPDYPAERLAYMLADSGSSLLLTTQNHKAIFTDVTIPCVWLDDWAMFDLYSTENLETGVSLDQLAYLIYTSGSTGKPKGVSIAHRSLAHMIAWHQDAFQLGSADRATLLAGPAFDATIWELWPHLTVGTTLYIPDNDTRVNPSLLRDWLLDNKITIAYLPTSLVDIIIQIDWPEEAPLRFMTTGGDVLHHYPPPGLPFLLVNNYGPTEYTVEVTTITLSPSEKLTTLPPIGTPIANTQIYILDDHLQPIPIGIVGELYVGGRGLARGYWQRPSRTAENFIPHPFSTLPGARLYKTGDLARFLPGGNIEFMGRTDQQVKIRGYRIELGEIEFTLGQHPGVHETAVIVHESDTGHKQLLAYPVLSDLTLTTEDLRAYLYEQLPAYMVPGKFVQLASLPLTANGKIDRKALPIPSSSTPVSKSYIAPETAVEQTLVIIWRDMLGLEQVGIHDNFFELGGDSILSIRIVAKAKEAKLHFTMRQLFQYQTIAELAAIVGTETAVAPVAHITEEPTPLTPIQHWFFEQQFAQSHHWNMALLLETAHPLNKTALEQAISALLAHHDALRMRFEQIDEKWRQINQLEETHNILHWFTNVDNPTRLIAEQQTSLNLQNGPLVRAAYFDRGQKPHQILFIVHHLVMDGVSWRILLEDLQTAYQQAEVRENISLPAKTTSFQTWAQQLTRFVQTDQFDPNLAYWQTAISAPKAMPLDHPDGDNSTASEATLSYSLTSAETNALLHDISTAYNTRIDEILLTALAQAYQVWTGEHVVTVNLEGHGREEILSNVDISRTIGWFTTLYPVTLSLANTTQLGDDIKRIKEQIRQIPDRGIEYGLMRYLHPDLTTRVQAGGETAVLSFNYLGQFNEQTDAGLFRIVKGGANATFGSQNQRPHMLDISGTIHNKQLHFTLRYSRHLHDKHTIDQFGRALTNCLRVLITHCQAPETQGYTPSDFAKADLSQGELDNILAELDGIL